jgi:hypothetical protein
LVEVNVKLRTENRIFVIKLEINAIFVTRKDTLLRIVDTISLVIDRMEEVYINL